MESPQALLALFACAVLPLHAADISVELTFELEPGSSRTLEGEIRGQPAGGDSDSASISGTIEATVVFDEETLAAKNITVTGGRAATGLIGISIEGTTFIQGVGEVDGTVRLSYINMAHTIRTTSPPGTVLPSGQLIPSEHTSTLNEGASILTISSPGIGSETQLLDFSDEPFSGVMQGSGSLVITEQSANPLERTLLFRIRTFHSEEESILLIDGSSARLDVTETVTTSSVATVIIPARAELVADPETGLRTGTITVNGQTYTIEPNANLSGADLSGADLVLADLRGANLKRADLSNANLSNANLRDAFLRVSNLSGANLSGANLSGADLALTDLRGADLSGADLTGVLSGNIISNPETILPSGYQLINGHIVQDVRQPAITACGFVDAATFFIEFEPAGTGYRVMSSSTLDFGIAVEVTPTLEPISASDNRFEFAARGSRNFYRLEPAQ